MRALILVSRSSFDAHPHFLIVGANWRYLPQPDGVCLVWSAGCWRKRETLPNLVDLCCQQAASVYGTLVLSTHPLSKVEMLGFGSRPKSDPRREPSTTEQTVDLNEFQVSFFFSYSYYFMCVGRRKGNWKLSACFFENNTVVRCLWQRKLNFVRCILMLSGCAVERDALCFFHASFVPTAEIYKSHEHKSSILWVQNFPRFSPSVWNLIYIIEEERAGRFFTPDHAVAPTAMDMTKRKRGDRNKTNPLAIKEFPHLSSCHIQSSFSCRPFTKSVPI